MIKLLHRNKSRQYMRIRGGIALPRDKSALEQNVGTNVGSKASNKVGSNETPEQVKTLTVPDELVIPLLDYQRRRLHTHLQPGDEVCCGDRLAGSIIAPASGIVSSIEQRSVAHPNPLNTTSIVIKVDHQRDAIDSVTARQAPMTHITLERLRAMGVTGLGGAGFPTHEKLFALNNGAAKTLIINGAECEPVIACDEAIMQDAECARDIIRGIGLLIELTACHQCVLVIENDKINAVSIMKNAVDAFNTRINDVTKDHSESRTQCAITLLQIEPVYPSGAERPLVELVTGIRLHPLEKPMDHGILCVNVATAHSVANAADGIPMISRVITVAGKQARHTLNVRARIGTSVHEVLRQTDNLEQSSMQQVRVGGPLSGFSLHDLDVPITVNTNCITTESFSPVVDSFPCIRCGACEDVCPTHLAPQQLYWFGRSNQQDYLDRYQIDNCIECACCDLVCPSLIPLTDMFRQLRAARQHAREEASRASMAELRYQAHIEREEYRARVKSQKRAEVQAKIKSAASSSDDVLARIKRKRDAGSDL